ncbi:hypothetical protein IEO21_06028 [Rhodonia placenta]|uniref:Cytochrome c oxidase subunit 8, mitochondrial n=2 Tax=Rhodonia placenta TaxID=104341 RepID=A0A1X6N3H2_9APHY|nr:hypothetical protein POSPLADRAFT_1039842 [Postia placenta MAD-698-R-SB12]KAF9812720.1 hypothetical protein IEO21_06028 [Postia placenta]OSX63070.1 hypothetical protein POSPLADRAFT_1039842 [Postia placenta MAD-698-R-SB12]
MLSLTRNTSPFVRLTSLGRVPRSPMGQLRLAHSEHTVHKHLPFDYTNKRAFAFKYTTFCVTAFSIPFIAVGWQLRKYRGAA